MGLCIAWQRHARAMNSEVELSLGRFLLGNGCGIYPGRQRSRWEEVQLPASHSANRFVDSKFHHQEFRADWVQDV